MLSDLDLWLYHTKAMPWSYRLKVNFVSLFSPHLRSRLRDLRESEKEFWASPQGQKMVGQTKPAKSHQRESSFFIDWLNLWQVSPARPIFATMLVMGVALGLWKMQERMQLEKSNLTFASTEPEGIIAKGSSLGITAFARGDSTWRLAAKGAVLSTQDTVQVLPMGDHEQYLMLMAYENGSGLTRVFPIGGQGEAQKVSAKNPPPSLIPSLGKQWLIAVTSTAAFSEKTARKAMALPALSPLEKAQSAHFEKGLYFQVFPLQVQAL